MMRSKFIRISACLCVALLSPAWLVQSTAAGEIDKVLTLLEEKKGPRGLPFDRGATGLWQRLLKLRTTASVLYTTAHPDDEQGGTLTYLSRGMGVRTAMLTLNRGESGANAIGSELFEALGLIRTEELRISNRYYGLDDQYFATMIDYGYSKNLEEALDQWGKDNVLRDMVRVIRINRPLVIVSRFHGSPRDGHGNHEVAGLISQLAFEAAGDAERYPEQIRDEGLRPWQPLKMYRSNLRPRRFFGGADEPPEERWNVRVTAGAYSPWLGQSYQNLAALGLSFQRSQTSGRRRESIGAHDQYFERVHSGIEAPEREVDFFDGIDTSIPGIFEMLGSEAPREISEMLIDVDGHLEEAIAAFDVKSPSAVAPFLLRALGATRRALEKLDDSPDARFLLRIKEEQLMDAIGCALGLDLRAVASAGRSSDDPSPFAAPPTLGVVVPGQSFRVDLTLNNPSSLAIEVVDWALSGEVDWRSETRAGRPRVLADNQSQTEGFEVTVPEDAPFSDRYYFRDSVRDSRYRIRDPRYLHLPARQPALTARVRYRAAGELIELRQTVHSRESNLPYGYEWREVKVAPSLAVNLEPETVVVPLSAAGRTLRLEVELLNNREDGINGSLRIEIPPGWGVEPPQQAFSFAQAGERAKFAFYVSVPELRDQNYQIRAVADADEKQYSKGYREIRHRDYETNYLYREAVAEIRGIDVEIAPGLKVGYVMGVGDAVPTGIEQLGAEVVLLAGQDLASADLSTYDVIVVGTRAYAVRQDLITYNQRLLDFVEQGGHLVVLYQTQEFIPEKWAPFPADLPRSAEEVSEEDSPVKILAPDHPVFQSPNRIGPADFEGWVEQRGSKFFTTWDGRYTALIEAWDRGQEPQKGGWVTARFGDGHYTYFAYAVHRQFPHGVAGMFRIFANLLSLGRN